MPTNFLNNFTKLGEKNKVAKLVIENSYIQDTEAVKIFNLRDLKLNNNQLKSYSFLKYLPEINNLSLTGNSTS